MNTRMLHVIEGDMMNNRQFLFYIPPGLHDKMKALSAEHGVSMSALSRTALDDFVDGVRDGRIELICEDERG